MLRKLFNFKSVVNIRKLNHSAALLQKEFNDQLPQKIHHEESDTLKILESSQLPELLHGLNVIRKNDLEPEKLTQIFAKIFTLYKDDFETYSFSIIQSPGFKNCCSILKYHAPRMMVNDLVTCLKVLVSLKLNSHNKLIQQLLYHIKEEINELSLSQLAFLNYLLTKMEKTPLISALSIAIPVVFDLNISMQLDHENPDELQKLLKHVTSSNMKVSEKSITNILSALILHGTSLSVDCAAQVIRSITVKNPNYVDKHTMSEKLVQNCIEVLNSKFDEADFTKIEITLDKLIRKFKQTNVEVFYNETFFNKCANHVISNDLGFSIAYHIIRRLNDINYAHYELLNYIDRKIIENPSVLSTLKLGSLINLISAFSTANYKSENWEIIKSIIHENPVLHEEVNSKYILLKFITDLLALDFVSKIFFNKVLEENFLAEYLNEHSASNFANYPQLRLINQALTLLHPEYDGILPDKILMDVANDAIPREMTTTNERLIDMLETIFGKGTVEVNVQTKHGQLLEYVMAFDNQNKAIVMPCKMKFYEDYPKNQVKTISIFFTSRKNCPINYPLKLRGIFALRKRTLDAVGIKELDIALHCLELLPDAEKFDYIEREIRYALENS